MNFEIFDDEFEQEKEGYNQEIKNLSKNLIESSKKTKWNKFVESNLVSTRNYYLITTALKVMKNINQGQDYDSALMTSLSFMPDFTFLETTIILVAKFHPKGEEFATYHKIDISKYIEEEKPEDKKFEAKKNINQKLKEEPK